MDEMLEISNNSITYLSKFIDFLPSLSAIKKLRFPVPFASKQVFDMIGSLISNMSPNLE